MAAVKGHYPSVAIMGSPGCGKSRLVRSILEDLNEKYVALGSYNSPYELFKAMSENPDATILIDDTAMSKHPVVNAILKSATGINENGNRLIKINTSDSVLKREGIASGECIFSGKLIFIANPEDLSKGYFTGAMNSRTMTFKYDLSFDEKMFLLNKFSENFEQYGVTDTQMNELINYLNQHITPACTNFDLRIFEKSIFILKTSPTDWKIGINRLLEIDPLYSKLIQIISVCDELNQPKSKRAELFSKVTGLSRSTYYDLCKKFGITRMNDNFDVPKEDFYRVAITDLISNSQSGRKKSKKVQNSSQIQEHTDKEVDMMSNGVQ